VSWSWFSRSGKKRHPVAYTSPHAAREFATPRLKRQLLKDLGAGFRLRQIEPPRDDAASVRGDMPEHYSYSFDCIVKSGRHHRELQRKHGTHDWEPVKDSPGSNISRQHAERMAAQRKFFHG